MDTTDLQILNELSKDSRITMKELVKKVHLTGPTASSRVEKLEDSGVIEGHTININQLKIDCTVHVMLNIFTKSVHHKPYLSFVQNKKHNVINNYKISGDSYYLLECKFQSNEKLNEFPIELTLQGTDFSIL